jgi:hypothetical protein
MKALILSAAIGALALSALPASAEVVIHENHHGLVVRHVDNGHHYGWRHHHHCRTVRIRTRLPNGNIIVKTRHTCR